MDALLLSLSRYFSYRSVAICIFATPVCHLCGILWHGLPSSASAGARTPSQVTTNKLALLVAFGYSGGTRSFAFQLAAWGLWAASGLACLPLWLPYVPWTLPAPLLASLEKLPMVPHTHNHVVSGAAAASSFIGLLFLLKSMLVYERRVEDDRSCSNGGGQVISLRRLRWQVMHSPVGQAVSRHGPAAAVLLMGLLLSVTGVLLLLSLEHMPDIPSRLLYCCLALVCLIIGASSTHGLGGYLQWGRTPRHTHSRTDLDGTCTPGSSSPTTTTTTATHDTILNSRSASPGPELIQLTAVSQVRGTGRGRRSLDEASMPDGGTVLPDEADIGISQGNGLLLTGRVGSMGRLEAALSTPRPPLRLGRSGDVPPAGSLTGEEAGSPGDTGALGTPCGGDLRSRGPLGLRGESEAGVDAAGRNMGGTWAFFQPFAGGTLFVVTQAIGWSLFAVTVVLIVALAKALLAGAIHRLRHWVLGTGVLMVLTQVVLGVSVLTWRNSQAARSLVRPILVVGRRTLRLSSSCGKPSPQHTSQGATAQGGGGTETTFGEQLAEGWRVQGLRGCWRVAVGRMAVAVRGAGIHVPMVVMFLPCQTFFSLWALSFAFLPARSAVVLWLTLLPVGYVLSLVGEPQHSGVRTWPAMRAWFSRQLEPCLTYWFGSVEVVADWEGDSPMDPDNRYIFGYHPHGLYPTGAGYLPLLPSFRRLLPNITPITLTATVIYYLPAIKDLSMWLGFRQVSRRTFVRALRDTRAVMICPGGQAELVYSYASHRPTRSINLEGKRGVGVGGIMPLPAPGRVGGPSKLATESVNGSGREEEPAGVAAEGLRRDGGAVTGAAREVQNDSPVSCAGDQRAAAAGEAPVHQLQQVVQGVDSSTHSASKVESSVTSSTDSTDSMNAASSVTGVSSSVTQGSSSVTTDNCCCCTPHSDVAPGAFTAIATQRQGMSSPAPSECASASTVSSSSGRTASISSEGVTAPTAAAGEMVIYTGHKGFVRLAIEQQAALVPVLALGEVLQLKDLVCAPALQKWTYKRIGFPFPYFCVGRWGVTPFPNPTPLIYVVGRPIQPPPFSGGSVSQSDVDLLHSQFYGALSDLYVRHAHRHPAFKDAPLTLLDRHV